MTLDVTLVLVRASSPCETTTTTTRTLLVREDVIQNEAHDDDREPPTIAGDVVSGLEGYWGLGGDCMSLAIDNMAAVDSTIKLF